MEEEKRSVTMQVLKSLQTKHVSLKKVSEKERFLNSCKMCLSKVDYSRYMFDQIIGFLFE